MDLNEITRQVSNNLKENISLTKEIKEGLSSWKRKLFGSKKEDEKKEETALEIQDNNNNNNLSNNSTIEDERNESPSRKQQLESLERLNEILSQSTAAKVNTAFKSLQKWYLAMTNEASIGMYYIQDHNRNIIESVVEEKREMAKTRRKLQVTTEQLYNTKKELKEISKLNTEWSSNIALYLDRLGKAL